MDVVRTLRPRKRWPLVVALGAVALTAVTGVLRYSAAQGPTADANSILVDTATLGPLTYDVEGPGVLEPEKVVWVSAVQAARVDQVLFEAGARVTKDTVVVRLSNPDFQLRALEGEHQLALAKVEYGRLAALLADAQLARDTNIAALSAEHADTSRRSKTLQQLSEDGLAASVDVYSLDQKDKALVNRLALEERRRVDLQRDREAQLGPQREQIASLERIVAFHKAQLASLEVIAGLDGVLQMAPVFVGQWVSPGTLLAKVAGGDKLKAVLQIGEVQAKDVREGQSVSIDTRAGLVRGHVMRIDPAAKSGTVAVDVELDDALPPAARPELRIDGVIEVERIANTLSIRKPPRTIGETSSTMLRLDADQKLRRIAVRLGRTTSMRVQVLDGLAPGDKVIVSDSSQWDSLRELSVR
ncbi:MAG TPA: HlyD family efflux transporter periplasmic adaptor subunit [Polyangiaceae bacterium]|nr:HlyD family efflux transporter periplasmic adaptor subunit [Polyangiaceae bacterium]